jgi:DNA polymerase-3 subunit alpha
MSSSFVHLHLHSEYSLLDGAIRFADALALAREYEMPALAMTDHGNLFGAVAFYKAARKAGVKPVIGCEVYVAPGSRFERGAGKGGQENHHLLLLVMDKAGYQNLMRLVSAGYLEGFYYKPRVDRELIEKHAQGLVALSACLHGEIPHLILSGKDDKARELARWYAEVFPQRFYLELMDNGIPEQQQVNRGLMEISKALDLPMVATNDCHYLRKEDSRAHDVLLCIQTGKTLEEVNRMRFQTDHFYFKSPEEMADAFREVPEALSNTLAIAEQCELKLEFGKYHFPNFHLPEEKSLEDHLEDTVRAGFVRRMEEIKRRDPEWFQAKEEAYKDRLEWELRIIEEMGFSGYFLIVADFIAYARQQGIPVGPGRGSAAGCLVAYSLNITDIDPIRYDLLFERFLNPERRSMPDIDIDFCKLRRDEVIRYVGERYGGADHVAQITTFGKMQARAVVRDVGRVLGMPYEEVDRIAKMIPEGLKMTLEKALQQEPRLGVKAQEDSRVRDLLDIARSLEGLVRHASTHAAGVVIADRPMVEHVPLYRSQHGEVVTQYDMKAVEEIGLIKFDFLGLRTLTMVHDTLQLMGRNGLELDIRSLPLDDAATFELLSAGNTEGVFQLESSGMKDLLTRMRPACFEDLIALVALYRPGPLGSGMVDEFIGRKHGKIPIQYEISSLEPILKETHGVIVYQEQVMQIASALAGYTMGQADVLRKAMGKKITSVMEEQKHFFIAGAVKNGISKDLAATLFERIAKFGEYGFNKSHSAAYALVAYQTAYLKAHHPVEFMAALLTSEKGNTDKVIRYMAACRDQGIEVLPPDVNESEWDFSVVEGKIRFGLGAVKNIGKKAIDAILEAREDGAFQSLSDFCHRVDLQRVNRRVIESLAKCGAFDSFGENRATHMALLDKTIEEAQKIQRARALGQMTMFNRMAMTQTTPDASQPLVAEWSELQRLEFEKESLGFYVTGHPLEEILGRVREWVNTDTDGLVDLPDKAEIRIVGVKRALRQVTTRKGDRMGFLTLEDLKGSVEVICFPETFRAALPLFQEEQPVCVRGHVEHAEEQSKVVASEIVGLDQIETLQAPPFNIILHGDRLEEGDLKRLRDLLGHHPGRRQMQIHLILEEGQVAVVQPAEDLRVELSEAFREELQVVFGARAELQGM